MAEKNEKHIGVYDIIICGAGLAGLSLACRAFQSGVWKHERILIIDKEPKNSNDRTWSFWQQTPSPFEHLITNRWTQLTFFANNGSKINLKQLPYTYNTIKGIDFYNYIKCYLQSFPNVHILQDKVESLISIEEECRVSTADVTYICKFAFNSLFKKPVLHDEQYFLQHFKGVKIRTSDETFDVNEAYLMDFRTSQKNGTTFFYTLPLKHDEVFIEYTLFSKELLARATYDEQIEIYIKEVLKLNDYEIIESEFGVIPMTDFAFKRRDGNIINIGTAGGDTRGSTGYTFSNVQKTVGKILEAYKQTGKPFFDIEPIGQKEKLYDATLLSVLNEGKYQGHQLFSDLFKNTDARTVFAFLDGDSSLLQDLKIMKSLRPWPFIKFFTRLLIKKAGR